MADPAATVHLMRVALVPLDERPINLQEVQLAGAVADVDVVVPPSHRLGRFTQEGDADGIAEWLDGLDVTKIDAVIVSSDMLAYGGQIASRRPAPSQERSLHRLEALGRLKARRKELRVYAFSTLLQLTPPDDGRKGKWKDTLLHWAELGGSGAADSSAATEVQRLESEIPPTMLEQYRTFRLRNLAVTTASIDLASKEAVDYLVLGVEDETPRGMAAAERKDLDARVTRLGAGSRIQTLAGPEQIALLLLARAVGDVSGVHPGVVLDVATPSLASTAESYLKAAGATMAKQAGPRDVAWLVASGPRDETATGQIVSQVTKLLGGGRRMILADVAADDARGASIPLVEALRTRHLFTRLSAYAGGTAPSTLALSLVQGLLRAGGAARVPAADAALQGRLADAQIMAMLHRLVVDFAYESVTRPQAITDYLEPRSMDPSRLDPDQTARVEAYLTGEIKPLVESLIGDMDEAPPSTRGPRIITTPRFRNLDSFKLKLPRGRLDEVEISFALK